MGWREVLLGLVAVLSAVVPGSAQAQTWLEPAITGAAIHGPAHSAGALIWSHGRSVDTEDSLAATPPYVAVLQNGGWDTFRFNRMRASDTLANSTHGLVEQVHRLKQQGYRKVVLAGQSFGGFVALGAADASDEVDAVIATAPAAFGSAADLTGRWRENATQLYPLLKQVRRARVMAFYFDGDDYDPGGRGERTNAILAARGLPHLVVDKPAGLRSHWAATTPAFAMRYGGCILGFVAAVALDDRGYCAGGASVATSDSAPPRRQALQRAAMTIGFAGKSVAISR